MRLMSKHSCDRDAVLLTTLWDRVLHRLGDGHWHARSALSAGMGGATGRMLRRFRHMGAPLRFDAARGVRLEYPLTPLVSRRGLAIKAMRLFEIDSTNAEMLRRASRGLRGPRALLAEHQARGRGRRGRGWATPLGGGIAMSLLIPRERIDRRMVVPLAVGVVLARALHRMGLKRVALKWPNDLWVGGRKLGGILVEARAQGVVIGVGLNHRFPPGWRETIGQPVTSLADEMGALLPPRARVVRGMLEALSPLAGGLAVEWREGFARFDALAGRTIRVQEASGATWDGEAGGIREDGALRVRVAAGERFCHAGDVSVRMSS